MRIKRATTIEDLKGQLDTIVEKPHKSSLVIDLKSLGMADTATVQLLLSFADTLKSSGTEPRWQNVSDGLSTTANLIGVDDALGWAA